MLSIITINKDNTAGLQKTLESLKKIDKKVTIVREITKIYEEVLQGTAESVLRILTDTPEKQKGEFVVIVSTK